MQTKLAKFKNAITAFLQMVRFKKLAIIAGLLLLGLIFIVIGSFFAIRLGCSIQEFRSPVFVQADQTTPQAQSVKAFKDNLKGYYRDEESSFLTFPEWYIVYSAHEYASVLKDSKPSSFPYFKSNVQFWCSYNSVYEYTNAKYAFNTGRHFMISVIGVSYTVENIIKGFYESTIGWATELVNSRAEEDTYAYTVANDYANFLHQIPWYEYPFYQKLGGLWKETNFFGWKFIRKFERKFILTLEYSIKEGYARLIKKGTKATYEPAPLQIMMHTSNIPSNLLAEEKRIKVIHIFEDSSQIIEIPRYEEFTQVILFLARNVVDIKDIAGNDEILVSVLANTQWKEADSYSVLFEMPILTEPTKKRLGLVLPVMHLADVLTGLQNDGITIEHLYDY